MAKKLIDVPNGYSLRFDQRARGQETPYWVGTIFKDGNKVGSFENGGTGGPTMVMPHTVEADFQKMVLDEAQRQGADASKWFENESLIIEFAELRGYRKGCATPPVNEFFAAYIKQVIADNAAFDKKYPKKS